MLQHCSILAALQVCLTLHHLSLTLASPFDDTGEGAQSHTDQFDIKESSGNTSNLGKVSSDAPAAIISNSAGISDLPSELVLLGHGPLGNPGESKSNVDLHREGKILGIDEAIEWVQQQIAVIGKTINAVKNQLEAFVEGQIKVIRNFIDTQISVVGNRISEVSNFVESQIATVGQRISDMRGFIEDQIAVLGDTINNVKNDLEAFVEGKIDVIRIFIDAQISIVGDRISEARNLFETQIATMGDTINNVKNELETFVEDKIIPVRNFIQEQIDAVKNWVEGRISNMKGEFLDEVRNFIAKIEKLVEDL